MRRVVFRRYGGPEVLEIEEVPAPQPGPGELLVEVAAAGVNFMDVYRREGRPPYAAAPPAPIGAEGAGRVVAAGSGLADSGLAGAGDAGSEVAGIGVGDRVAWTGVQGSYADAVVVAAANAVVVPDAVPLEVAAAVMLQGMTAHYLCHSTHPVGEGDPVVVHAAAGGVGLLLTQMIRRRGGRVVATTSTPEKAEAARRAGAELTAGYDDFGEAVAALSGGAGAVAVYDSVGAATFDASLAALRPRGHLVVYGASSGPVPPLDLMRLMVGGSLSVTRPTLGSYVATREELEWRSGDLFSWIAEGTLQVAVGGRYPLEEAGRAHEDLEGRRTSGKLLLVP